jgi:hypothetical protein
MSKPPTPKPESTNPEELQVGSFGCRCAQPILISTAFQRRMGAVERRIVIEDVM